VLREPEKSRWASPPTRPAGASPTTRLCGLEGDGQSGWWWVAGNLVRDVAALSKMELLPWDVWGGMPSPGGPVGDFDEVAAMTAAPASAADCRARYEQERFRVPARVYNFLRQAHEPVGPAFGSAAARVSRCDPR